MTLETSIDPTAWRVEHIVEIQAAVDSHGRHDVVLDEASYADRCRMQPHACTFNRQQSAKEHTVDMHTTPSTSWLTVRVHDVALRYDAVDGNEDQEVVLHPVQHQLEPVIVASR